MGTQNINCNCKFIEVVKTCDLDRKAAIEAFISLNMAEGKQFETGTDGWRPILKTSQNPAEMLFPSGWYFAKRSLRNKHHSSTGLYAEVSVWNMANKPWTTCAVEAARQCDGKDFSASVCARVVAAMNSGAKLVGATQVMVKTGQHVKVLEGWDVCGSCAMGFMLRSGNKIVKIFFA